MYSLCLFHQLKERIVIAYNANTVVVQNIRKGKNIHNDVLILFNVLPTQIIVQGKKIRIVLFSYKVGIILVDANCNTTKESKQLRFKETNTVNTFLEKNTEICRFLFIILAVQEKNCLLTKP